MKPVKSVEQSREEAVELCLFAENDSRCYHNYLVPAFKNQQRHYDRNLAREWRATSTSPCCCSSTP